MLAWLRPATPSFLPSLFHLPGWREGTVEIGSRGILVVGHSPGSIDISRVVREDSRPIKQQIESVASKLHVAREHHAARFADKRRCGYFHSIPAREDEFGLAFHYRTAHPRHGRSSHVRLHRGKREG